MKHNKLFLLSNKSGNSDDYDVYVGFVVDAMDEQEARKIAQDEDRRNKIWIDENTSYCHEIGTSINGYGKSSIIMAAFRAG